MVLSFVIVPILKSDEIVKKSYLDERPVFLSLPAPLERLISEEHIILC
jgi:hypothetical protein